MWFFSSRISLILTIHVSLSTKFMQQQNIHYPDHLVQYSLNKSRIESLITGTVMLGGLEKVSWVELK